MSEEQLKAFLEVVQADAILHEKLKAATDVDAVVAIAKTAGFVVSAEELNRAQSADLSDEQLERVGGGSPSFLCAIFSNVGTACISPEIKPPGVRP